MGCQSSKEVAVVQTESEKVSGRKSEKKNVPNKKKKDPDVEVEDVQSNQNGVESAGAAERPEVDPSTLPDQLKAQVNAQSNTNVNGFTNGNLTPLISAPPSVTTSFSHEASVGLGTGAVPEATAVWKDVEHRGEEKQVKQGVLVELKPDHVHVSVRHVERQPAPAASPKGHTSSKGVDVAVTTVTTSSSASVTDADGKGAMACIAAARMSPSVSRTGNVSAGVPPGSPIRSPTFPASRTPTATGSPKVAPRNPSTATAAIVSSPHPPGPRSSDPASSYEPPSPPSPGSLHLPRAHDPELGQQGPRTPQGHNDNANFQSIRSEASESEWMWSHYRQQQEQLRQPGAPPPIPDDQKKAALAALRQSFRAASSGQNTPAHATPSPSFSPTKPPSTPPTTALQPPTKPSLLLPMTPEASPPASPRYRSVVWDEMLRQPGAPPPLSMEEKNAALAALKHSYKSADARTFTAGPTTPAASTPVSTSTSFATSKPLACPYPVAQSKPTTASQVAAAQKPATSSTSAAAVAGNIASRWPGTATSAPPSRQSSSTAPAQQAVSDEIVSLYSPRKAKASRPGLPALAVSAADTEASLEALKKSFNTMKNTKEQWAPAPLARRAAGTPKTPAPALPTKQEAVQQKLSQLLETNKPAKSAPATSTTAPPPHPQPSAPSLHVNTHAPPQAKSPRPAVVAKSAKAGGSGTT